VNLHDGALSHPQGPLEAEYFGVETRSTILIRDPEALIV
jgi:hypothetical protein